MKLYILTLFVAASMSAQTVNTSPVCDGGCMIAPMIHAVHLPQPSTYRNEWKPTVAVISLGVARSEFGKPLPKVVILPQPPSPTVPKSQIGQVAAK